METTAELEIAVEIESLSRFNKENISSATAEELYDLTMLCHPNDHGLNLYRSDVLKEWERRGGKAVTEALGLPTDDDYPYLNRHTSTVECVSDLVNSNDNIDWWFSLHEHNTPLTDFDGKLAELKNRLAEEMKKPVKAKLTRSQNNGKYLSDYDVRELREQIGCIEKWLDKSGNTKPSTCKQGIQPVFKWKEKKFSISVSIGEDEGKLCILWNWSLQQKTGGSAGDAHTTGYMFEDKTTALRAVIGQVNNSILKRVKDFSQYHWAAAYVKAVPEASPVQEEKQPATKEVDRIIPGTYECVIPYNNENGYQFSKTSNLVVLLYHAKEDYCVCKLDGETEYFYVTGDVVRKHWKWWMLDGDCELRDGSTFSKRYNESIPIGELLPPAPVEEKPIIKQVDGLQQVVMFDVPEEKKKADPNAELFGYIAKDKGDRQRFKRKKDGFIDKLSELPALERNALIRAINSKFTPPHF